MNSDEREERLKRIRQQRELKGVPFCRLPSWGDVDFLLSLLDSQAARPVHRNYECFTTVADETLWCPTCACRAEYLRGQSDAVTRMRDLCVEKVKELIELLKDGQSSAQHAIRRTAFQDVLKAIQSLTLDRVEEKQ